MDCISGLWGAPSHSSLHHLLHFQFGTTSRGIFAAAAATDSAPTAADSAPLPLVPRPVPLRRRLPTFGSALLSVPGSLRSVGAVGSRLRPPSLSRRSCSSDAQARRRCRRRRSPRERGGARGRLGGRERGWEVFGVSASLGDG